MSRELTSTVTHFLKTQVMRHDYIVVGEPPTLKNQLPYEQKLARMHDLCVHNGYRTPDECEQVRRQLYGEENETGRPATLLLIEAYLPACIVKNTNQEKQRSIKLMSELEHEAGNLPCKASYLQSSKLDWNGDSYLLCLPLDIHFLLMESDGALLAA